MRYDQTNLPPPQRFPLTINYNLTCQNGSLWLDPAPLSLFFCSSRGFYSHSFPTVIVFWHITLLDPPQRSPIIHFWYHCLVVELEKGCTLGSGSQDWQWDINSFVLVWCDGPLHCNHVLVRGKLPLQYWNFITWNCIDCLEYFAART